MALEQTGGCASRPGGDRLEGDPGGGSSGTLAAQSPHHTERGLGGGRSTGAFPGAVTAGPLQRWGAELSVPGQVASADCPWLLPRGPGPQAPRGQLSGEPEDGPEDGPNSEPPGSWEGPPGQPLFQPRLDSPRDRQLAASMGAGGRGGGPLWPRESRGEQEEVSGCVGPRALGTGASSMGRGGALPSAPSMHFPCHPLYGLPGALNKAHFRGLSPAGVCSPMVLEAGSPRPRWAGHSPGGGGSPRLEDLHPCTVPPPGGWPPF